MNLVIEPLLLAIPVVFALGYGVVAVLVAARKPEPRLPWVLPVVLVIPVAGCLLALPQHYELVPAGEPGHYPQFPAAVVAIVIVVVALAVSVISWLRDRDKKMSHAQND